MKGLIWVALVTAIQSAGLQEARTPLPAELVARQIQAAMADPRNGGLLEQAEAALAAYAPSAALASEKEPLPPPGEESLERSGIVGGLATRIAQSKQLITDLAADVRRGAPPALASWAAPLRALSTWAAPWIVVGALLFVFLLARSTLRRREPRALRTAEKLSRRGVGTGEVARRTGLSRDVIRLVKARRKSREVA